MLEHDQFHVCQGWKVDSIWIKSVYTRVITRIEGPYPIAHLVYDGNRLAQVALSRFTAGPRDCNVMGARISRSVVAPST